MNITNLVVQSLKFHWRDHLGVILGTAVASTVLVGALGVGDSVRGTLSHLVEARVGKIDYLLFSKDRFFRQALGKDLSKHKGQVGAGIMIQGTVATPNGRARANQVQVLGMNEDFWQLAPSDLKWRPKDKQVGINQALANQLSVKQGDWIVLRVERPSLISRDAPISGGRDYLESMRFQVARILDANAFGLFSLRASHLAPYNVYIESSVLNEALGFQEKANLLVVGDSDHEGSDVWNTRLEESLKIEDFSLQLTNLSETSVELTSERVFIDRTLQKPLIQAQEMAFGILTYMVNEIKISQATKTQEGTPYSMVTAVNCEAVPFLPNDLAYEEMVVNQWLADDLGISIGDELSVRYYVEGERRELIEQEQVLRVREILPMEGNVIDSRWMPDFPGISEEDDCREWDPGVPIDLEKIRDKDEVYWDTYKGAPKAFVNLTMGQKMWGSRFGEYTAIRYENTPELAQDLRARIKGSDIGLSFLSFAESAKQGSKAPFDFAELFLSFSFFIMVAAALLIGLFFVFSLERRSREIGLLHAIGWSKSRIGQLFIFEGLGVAFLGSLIGVLGGMAYTGLMLWGLASIWKGAVGEVTFMFQISWLSVFLGILVSLFIAWGSMIWVLRKQLNVTARELLSGLIYSGVSHSITESQKAKYQWDPWLIVISLLGVVILSFQGQGGNGMVQAGMFFGAGSLVLFAGVLLCKKCLGRFASLQLHTSLTKGKVLTQLALRNAARRRSRSLVVVGVLACGVFMVVSVGIFRKDVTKDAGARDSGTGGFTLWAETTVPIYDDLNRKEVRDGLGFTPGSLVDLSFVPFRVMEGDEASCLNLNSAQSPRILGVKSQDMITRKAFRFADKNNNQGRGWHLLTQDLGEGVIPAIGDLNSLMWSMGLKVGDELDYIGDNGALFRLRIVAAVTGSLLQGNLLIDEEAFRKMFVDEGGYQTFLIDTQRERADVASKELSSVLGDYGMSVTPTWEKLARLNAVENAYISMFQVLGGLGLLLGSFGVAVTLLRNVMERRAELGLLRAVGFQMNAIWQLVVKESLYLMIWGLGLGVLASLLAIGPVLIEQWNPSMMVWLVTMVTLLCCLGLIFSWRAGTFALKQAKVEVLRTE